MRRFTRSTFALAGLISILFAVATIIIGAIVFSVAHEALEAQLDHRISAETQAILYDDTKRNDATIAATIGRLDASRSTTSLEYLLVDRLGRRLAGSLAAPAPEKPGYVELLHYGTDGRIAQAVTTLLPSGSRLVVAADRAIIDELDRTILLSVGGALLAMLVLGAAGAWTIGAVTRARLDRIDRTAHAIIGGDLSYRVPIDGSGSEFDRVAETLNRMLDRIGALMDNLRQVSSDVAHDLRTPLTRLRNRLEEAQRAVADPEAHAIVAAAGGQAEELLEIFSSLLRITEVESLRVREHFRDVPLDLLIDELMETYQPDAEASGHTLVAAIDPSVTIVGDRRLLQQMLSNLLDNALRHTPEGTTVSVSLRASDGEISLLVADDGPGIPAEDRDRVFQRFARSERSRSSEGNGLGLAMVAAIAQAHRGIVTLLDGTGFRICFTMKRGAAFV